MNLGKTLDLVIKSSKDRKNNTGIYAFTQMPTTENLINQMCLRSKQLTLDTILKPTIYHNLSLSLTSPKDAVKNALTLDVYVVIMQANNALMDLQSIKHDYLNEGLGICKEILELVEQYREVNMIPV